MSTPKMTVMDYLTRIHPNARVIWICPECTESGHPDGWCCCDEPGCEHNGGCDT